MLAKPVEPPELAAELLLLRPPGVTAPGVEVAVAVPEGGVPDVVKPAVEPGVDLTAGESVAEETEGDGGDGEDGLDVRVAELGGSTTPEVALLLVAVAVAVAVLEVELEAEMATAGQVKLKRGVVLSSLPTIPKLGLGAVGAASWRMYHQVLTLSKSSPQPTWSQ